MGNSINYEKYANIISNQLLEKIKETVFYYRKTIITVDCPKKLLQLSLKNKNNFMIWKEPIENHLRTINYGTFSITGITYDVSKQWLKTDTMFATGPITGILIDIEVTKHKTF